MPPNMAAVTTVDRMLSLSQVYIYHWLAAILILAIHRYLLKSLFTNSVHQNKL